MFFRFIPMKGYFVVVEFIWGLWLLHLSFGTRSSAAFFSINQRFLPFSCWQPWGHLPTIWLVRLFRQLFFRADQSLDLCLWVFIRVCWDWTETNSFLFYRCRIINDRLDYNYSSNYFFCFSTNLFCLSSELEACIPSYDTFFPIVQASSIKLNFYWFIFRFHHSSILFCCFHAKSSLKSKS